MSSIIWLWSRSLYISTHTSLLYQTISPFLFLLMLFCCCSDVLYVVVFTWLLCFWMKTLLFVFGVCAWFMNVAGFNHILHVPLKPPELLGSSKTARSRIARSPAWWSWADYSSPVCLQAWMNLQVTATYYAISHLFCLNLIIVCALHPVFLHEV